MDTNLITKLVLETITELQQERIKRHVYPCYVSLADINTAFRDNILEATRYLCKSGVVEHHRNINGVSMFEIRTNKDATSSI